MSQIGYMVLGVSAFAYGAGMFHLMTHAFFKALLFMGAGSVIAAMGGIQSLDKMGGFRKAMPFTFVTFTIGALALAGFPLFSGFFSKDEIIAFTLHRGGMYTVLGVIAYIAALMTAFYSFRMVIRVFFGEPVEEARELEQGHLAHHAPANPVTGESEDTDVGFPGPEHHIAEREWPMKAAMAPLAFLAIVGGVLGIPGVTDTLEKFLEPAFEGSHYIHDHPSESAEHLGLVIGGVISIVGIALAWFVYVKRAGLSLQLRDRMRPVHDFLAHKWYFDELYDLTIVRPLAAFGRLCTDVVESRFVQGVVVDGSVSLVRASSDFARGLQTGYLRSYALLLVTGVLGVAIYLVVQGS
jgi:NADH-quinone oxidoreductase subunit L